MLTGRIDKFNHKSYTTARSEIGYWRIWSPPSTHRHFLLNQAVVRDGGVLSERTIQEAERNAWRRRGWVWRYETLVMTDNTARHLQFITVTGALLTISPPFFFFFFSRCIILSRWNPLTVRKQVVSGFMWNVGWEGTEMLSVEEKSI